MVMDWSTYYRENKHIGDINEVAAQYNMYVYQNQEQYDAELIRKMGTNIMILQENGYTLIQEGEHQYGLLQEVG
jgi:hypothetical protein